MGPESGKDVLIRDVLFALELLDPAAGTRVARGMTVTARGADGRPTGVSPIVSCSGAFVWLDTGRPAPARVVYEPGRLPYASGEVDLTGGVPKERLVSRMLRPTRAYEVPPGITALRGRLTDGGGDDPPPIADAIVQIAWGIRIQGAQGWIPPAPPDLAHLRPGEAVTDADGEFVVLARLLRAGTPYSAYVGYPPPDDPAFDKTLVAPELIDGFSEAQLRVTRLDIGVSRVTPPDYRFPGTPSDGVLPDGRMPAVALKLNWQTLN